MSKGNTFENDLMKLVFQGSAIANLADNAASAPLSALYVSLHTGDPDEAGYQDDSETTYNLYARQPVGRDSGSWTVSNNQAKNTLLVQFPQCGTGSPSTISYVGVGTQASGTGKLLYSGQLSSNLTVDNLIQPQFAAQSLVIEED